MIDTIDESVLTELLAQIAEEIPVPAAGPDDIVDAFVTATTPNGHPRRRYPTVLAVAAAAVVLALVLVPILRSGSDSAKDSAGAPDTPVTVAAAAPITHDGPLSGGAIAQPGSEKSLALGGKTAYAAPPTPADAGVGNGSGSTAASGATAAASGPVDGAKIVKTGTLSLQTPHATLRATVNGVTATTVGLGGYVADSNTSYGGTNPTAQITIRVPVDNFETAIKRLEALAGVTVVSDSENGADVTKQYTDLAAQLSAATAERNAFLVILSRAQSIGDILAVNDRVTAAQTTVDELQGQINNLNDQTSFSSLAITLAEKAVHPKPAVVHHARPQTGLAKSWSDARHGFASSVEWLIARSGGALIVLLAALALLFAVRYLYPVVRRALV